MKHFFFILLLSVFFISTSYADGLVAGAIQGVIIDEDTNTGLEYVSVAIFTTKDKKLVTGTISDDKGNFSIKGIPEGKYYLEITFIGYGKKIIDEVEISSNKTQLDLGKIVLPKSVEQLDEVQIVADEMSVAYKIDRKVINVSQQLTAASGSAVDILQNLPSITVDIAGNVALRGSTGFMVLIDGRPTVLESSEALQQIPANTIENIEIITNPSAKYNPDGTAGIINIITKKNKLKGFSGTGNLNLGNFDRFGGGFLVNYTNKKLTTFFGADYNTGKSPGHEFTERLTTKDDTTFFTRSSGNEDRKREFWVLRGGLGYNISDKDIFNLEFNYGYGKHRHSSQQEYSEGIEPGGMLNEYTSDQVGERGGNFYSINGTFQHDFDTEGHKIVGQIQYRSRNSEEFSLNQLIGANDYITSGQRNTEDGPGAVLELNLDYTQPFGESQKLEAGYQARLGRSKDKTSLSMYHPASGEYINQPEFSNDTEYSRDIHALYGIYGGEKGNFGYQLGLRGEYTYRIISSATVAGDFLIDRFEYFPTLHTSYKMPAEQQVMASYSRRIERPRSYYLEPFITWSDAFNVRQGNPGLKPEYIDAMELAYLKGLGEHSFSFEGYYRITNNKTERIRSVYQDNVMLSRPENVGQDFALGGEMVLTLNFFKWWKIDLSGNFYNYQLKGRTEEQTFDRESFNWNSRLSNTFRLFEGNRMQLNGRYNSATVTAQGKRNANWTADLALSQEFWKKRMTAIVQVRDIFGRVIEKETSSGIDFYSYSEEYNDAPQFSLTLNYRFNNFKNKKGEGAGGEGDDF
ncbi:MAG: TonB-dependent receptor [Cyclobacteriaceae bacterium]|nr:TonB-dependent receptor [Cyclobacteriaceae bacterium]